MPVLEKIHELILPNKEKINISNGKTYHDIISEHMPHELSNALAVEVNGNTFDLSRKADISGELRILTFKDKKGKEVFWHSSAHVLAQAIKRHYPQAQLTVGPVVWSGPGFFYYDIQLEEKINELDFPPLEKEMENICKEDHEVTRKVYELEEVIQLFEGMGEFFKAQIIRDLPKNEEITVYKQGEFQDLCRGPHVSSTKKLGFFKITAVAGAHWKGDTSKPMLQRIYGISFPTRKELKQHLHYIEEAKKRDHRKLGKELELFSFEEAAPGLPFYQPKGTTLFNILSDYIRKKCSERGYEEIKTPAILSSELWTQSGHYENFRENMYFTQVEDKDFAIKPMNCPGANLTYKNIPKSYRDLPLKLAELGTVHRHELSGVLHGLFRTRAFTQDDAHIYCTYYQLQAEISSAIQFTLEVYHEFGFKDTEVFLATRPEKALGSKDIWDKATMALTSALESNNISFGIKQGEGAFYGPKIEFNIKDCLQRNWQCGTIQVDFSMPERFKLLYTGPDGNKHRPVMVHRAILGSLERFMGILIEHYAGKLPLWLSPTQISIMTVNSAQTEYALQISKTIKENNFRIEEDLRNEKIGYKIREWNQKKINYAIILGQQEQEKNQIALRSRGEKETSIMELDALISKLKGEYQI